MKLDSTKLDDTERDLSKRVVLMLTTVHSTTVKEYLQPNYNVQGKKEKSSFPSFCSNSEYFWTFFPLRLPWVRLSVSSVRATGEGPRPGVCRVRTRNTSTGPTLVEVSSFSGVCVKRRGRSVSLRHVSTTDEWCRGGLLDWTILSHKNDYNFVFCFIQKGDRTKLLGVYYRLHLNNTVNVKKKVLHL